MDRIEHGLTWLAAVLVALPPVFLEALGIEMPFSAYSLAVGMAMIGALLTAFVVESRDRLDLKISMAIGAFFATLVAMAESALPDLGIGVQAWMVFVGVISRFLLLLLVGVSTAVTARSDQIADKGLDKFLGEKKGDKDDAD